MPDSPHLSCVSHTRRAGPSLVLLAVLLLGWLCPAQTGAVQAAPTPPAYSLDAEVDYDGASVQVEQRLRYPNLTGQRLDRLVFQVASTQTGSFQLQSASVARQPVDPTLDGSLLDLPLPNGLAPGEAVEVDLGFRLDLPRRPGRLSAGPHGLSLASWFPLLVPHRGDWLRFQYVDVGDAFVSEVADFELRLNTSRSVVVASSGQVAEGARLGTRFRVEARGVRDFALSLSPDYEAAEERAGEVVVRAFTSSQPRSAAYAAAAARFLSWYSQRLGAYPYRTLTVAEAELPPAFGGLEYPGYIQLTPGLALPERFEGSSADFLIGHEVAHQWFYSLVGNDQVADPWLDEAFAQYLPYWYFQSVAPAVFSEAWNRNVASGLEARVLAAGGRTVDAAITEFPDDGPYFTTVYRQGAYFLEQLRQTAGEAAFEAALRELVSTYADGLATPLAVLDLFQRHAQTDLTPLFARYFAYRAYTDAGPGDWRLELPDGALSGPVPLFVSADFPLTKVEVWLGSRLLFAGQQNALSLDFTGVEPGDYVLLVRVWDQRGFQLERAQQVTVQR